MLRTKTIDQKKRDGFKIQDDDIYSPDVGRWGKRIIASKWGPHDPIEEWDERPDKIDSTKKDLTMQMLKREIDELWGEIQELKGERREMKKFVIKPDPQALGDLFEILNGIPPKFKNEKEFQKWLEEEE